MRFALVFLAFLSSTIALGVTGTASFEAVGNPGFLKIKGDGGKITQVSEGTYEVALDDFKTGIDLRDEHMKKEFFEIAKFPKATLKLASVPTASGEVKGTLTLHGVTKDVTVSVKMDGGKAQADMKILLSDFDIKIPTYKGITVAKDVTVHADLQK